jgi:ATP-dependent RNA helicase SUPV3L1/SUV3
LSAPDKEKVQERLATWMTELIGERLKPLVEISAAKDITGLARGIAFRMSEGFGALRREAVAEEMRSLDQTARAQLRSYGVRFGAFNIYFPLLLKPASAELALTLWVLKYGSAKGLDIAALPQPPRAGLTSVVADKALPEDFYRVSGYHVCGPRAVRIDILERLADQIRPLVAWRPDPEKPTEQLKGASGDGGFRATPEMMSILGCTAAELGNVLQALGFRLDRVRVAPSAAIAHPAAETASTAGEPAPTPELDAVPSAAVAAVDAPNPVAEVTVPAPGPESVAAPGAAKEAPAAIATAEPAAEQWDEIWRPRRQGRRHKHRSGRKARASRRGISRQGT